MSELQIGFLYNAATILRKDKSNETRNILASYYLMKCKEITRGYGLPRKQFSTDSRCPHCCTEWNKNVEIRVTPLKHSKQKRKKLGAKKNGLKRSQNKKRLLKRIKLEKICSFCGNVTSTSTPKLNKRVNNNKTVVKTKKAKKRVQTDVIKPLTNETTLNTKLYCYSKDAFSLMNKNNTLPNVNKEKPKIVNCKKKKDKFVGLCQKAVLEAKKNNTNKIDMFLKPSL